MMDSKLKILFYLTISLTLLFAPFSLDILPGGETYAMAKWFPKDQSNSDSAGHIKVASPEQKSGPSNAPIHPTPEPATLLLFGAGAVSLAAIRKKFRKK